MLPRSGDDLVHRVFRIDARAPWHAHLSKTSGESFLKSRVFQGWGHNEATQRRENQPAYLDIGTPGRLFRYSSTPPQGQAYSPLPQR